MVVDEDEVDSPEDEDGEVEDTVDLLPASTTTGLNNNNHFDRLHHTAIESRG